MAAIAEPPVAAPAVTPAPIPASGKEIFVSTMPKATTPPEAPKPGSAKEGMVERMKSRAKPEPGTEAQVAEKPKTSEATPTTEKAEASPAAEPPEATATDPKTGEKKKVNPWKLVDEYKAKLAKLEAEQLEVSKRALPKEEWEKTQSEIAAEKKRNQELEEEIKYVNYSKSKEFQEKYQRPYDEAWKRAMSELGELVVEDGGSERPLQPADILELVNLPLPEARSRAEQLYGPFANDIMQHRKEIRNLFDQQVTALDEAKKGGIERTKKLEQEYKQQYEATTTEIRSTWSKANEEAQAHPKYGSYFKPVEGDEQGNQRLAKGFELADRAFSENPLAPGITPEQRKAIVERHAAVRNRAAAFGKLVHLNETKDATIAELKKELEQYKASEPGAAGRKPDVSKNQPGGMSGLAERLRSRAK